MNHFIKKLYQYFSHLLRVRLSKVQYMMVVSVIVGLASGLAAVLLKTLVHHVQQWIEEIPVSVLKTNTIEISLPK